MLSFNKDEGFIHCDMLEEALLYPQEQFITVDSEWFRIAGTLKDFEGGWCVMLRPSEQPRGIEPLRNHSTLGNGQLWVEPTID